MAAGHGVIPAAPARRLLVPGLSTAIMLAILLSLGVWQVQRLAWKTDLLARIDAAERSPGADLTEATPPGFAKVRVSGTLRPGPSALYGAEVRDERGQSVLGAQLITPLLRDAGAPLLIQRGWVDAAHPAPAPPAGPIAVEGWVHLPEPAHWFSPADDPAALRFFTLDPAAIGAALGLPAVAPYVLVALGPPGIPDPARALPRPPNDHLQYALTWFGFAVTLLVIFAVYARRILRP